jgi:hypothetical protein
MIALRNPVQNFEYLVSSNEIMTCLFHKSSFNRRSPEPAYL